MSSIIRTYRTEAFAIDVPFTGEGYFNATIAAKPFGKRPADWLKTDETQAYISAITTKIVIEEYQLVRVVSGAPETGGGTWLHPKLGIAFARWLDPLKERRDARRPRQLEALRRVKRSPAILAMRPYQSAPSGGS